MIAFDEALDRVAREAGPLGSECVPLRKAHGRVLAEAVRARISAPPCDVSAMDGYAVRDADLARLPAALPVAGESFAGRGFEGQLPAGGCVRIFTGAPVPSGADRVVVQEAVRREGDRAVFDAPPGPARHIRTAGSDFREGDELVGRGTLLSARSLVALAGGDCAELVVYRRPSVAVIATGDELVEPGQACGNPGRIPESVSIGVGALAAEAGALFRGSRRLPDDLAELRAGAAAALAEADVVVVTGGASVGERDFARTMFDGEGLELIFSKVAIKPGKPVWLGRAAGKLVVGLPGNPTSALVTARLFLVPLLYGLTGRDPRAALRWRELPLAEALGPAGERETFSRGFEEAGRVRMFGHQDSSAQKLLAQAELLIRRRPGNEPYPAGSTVCVLDF